MNFRPTLYYNKKSSSWNAGDGFGWNPGKYLLISNDETNDPQFASNCVSMNWRWFIVPEDIAQSLNQFGDPHLEDSPYWNSICRSPMANDPITNDLSLNIPTTLTFYLQTCLVEETPIDTESGNSRNANRGIILTHFPRDTMGNTSGAFFCFSYRELELCTAPRATHERAVLLMTEWPCVAAPDSSNRDRTASALAVIRDSYWEIAVSNARQYLIMLYRRDLFSWNFDGIHTYLEIWNMLYIN